MVAVLRHLDRPILPMPKPATSWSLPDGLTNNVDLSNIEESDLYFSSISTKYVCYIYVLQVLRSQTV